MTFSRTRLVLLGAVAAVVIAAGAVGVLLLSQSDPEPIEIGVILPLSGPFPEGAQKLRNGIDLAIDEVNLRGGVNGRPLEIVVEDGALKSEMEQAAFASIEESTRPLFYIAESATLAEGISDLAEDSEVVLLNLIITESLGGEGWTFQYGLDIHEQDGPIFELLDRLSAKRLGFLFFEFFTTEELLDQFEERLARRGIALQSDSIEFGQTDFTSELKAFKDTDAIYIHTTDHVPLLIEQARAQGYKGSFLMVPPNYEAVPFELPLGEAVYLGAPAVYNPNFLPAQEVAERYREVVSFV